MTSRSASLGLVAAAACWGSTVVAIKVAERGLPSLGVTVVETTIAIATLAVVSAYRRQVPWRVPWPALAAGVLEPGLTYLLINLGLARTSGLDGALLIGTESLFIVLLSAAWRRRMPSAASLLGLSIALGGSVGLASRGGHASVVGDVLVGAGSLAAAGYVVVTHHYASDADAVAVTTGQFGVGAVFTLLVAGVAGAAGDDPFRHATPGAVVAALVAGVLGSTVGFLAYNTALARVSVTEAALAVALIPVFGAVFSLLVLGGGVTATNAVAGVAIVTGVTVAQWAETRPAAEPT